MSSASAWSTPRTSRRAASSAARLRLRRGEREAEDRPEQVDEQVVGQVAPVRDAAALEPAGGRRWGEGGNLELGEKAALADARLADDERRPTPTCGDDVEQRGQALQLLGAPDHGAVEPDGFEPAPAGRRGLSADDAKGVDRLGLALDLDLAEIVEVERVAGKAARASSR